MQIFTIQLNTLQKMAINSLNSTQSIVKLKITMTRLLILIVAATVGNVLAKDWWETAAFYQIYPRSFQDSNGDGIGDLNGITSRLPYLKELGITAFWLSPIFQSPMKDFGYDISDFKAIHSEYGTMEDFENLVRVSKTLGLKVILDFVPNHSSEEHEWFGKSVRREAGFEDFYLWHDGLLNPDNPSGTRLPPNNWLSAFKYSAWQWNEERGQFYYHAFAVQQPDLNYRNPAVLKAMRDVLVFWLDKGVDGFRIDAVPNVFEIKADASGNYLDEPLSGATDDENSYKYLAHIYTTDQPETTDLVYQWRALMDDYQRQHGGETRVVMTEIYSKINFVMDYYGNATMEGAHMPFNFQFILNLNKASTAVDYKKLADYWMDNMPKGRTANWVMGNHDNNRVASRYGVEKVDGINMFLLTMPGASVTFNGEEIGMTDVWISWEDSVDPQACNTNSSVYMTVSRDPERSPFQWDATTSAGFSTSTNTWLPVSPDYRNLNVANQEAAARSHLKVFRELTALRKSSKVLQDGSLETFAVNTNVFVIVRRVDGKGTLVTVINFGGNIETVNLSALVKLPANLKVEVPDSSAKRTKG
jgi:alpha-glucosidase